jgi:Ser/Thr protein kinase RdoA (MazF antagonist)
MYLKASRLQSEAGNSVLEFVLFFTLGLILIVSLSASLESEFRARMATLSIANEALRVWQISGDLGRANVAAAQTALVFFLDQGRWAIDFDDACSSANLQSVEVRVGQVIERARGTC